MRESAVERYLCDRIKALGGEVRKLKFIGHNGAPDRLVLLPGYNCMVELKRPKRGAEEHQAREHMRLRDAGIAVLLIDTKTLVDKHFPLN